MIGMHIKHGSWFTKPTMGGKLNMPLPQNTANSPQLDPNILNKGFKPKSNVNVLKQKKKNMIYNISLCFHPSMIDRHTQFQGTT